MNEMTNWILTYYGYRPYGFYLDWTYLLVVAGVLLCLGASAAVNSNFKKYSRVRSRAGITGAEAARRILSLSGITDVQVQQVSGHLTDHYDPRKKTVSLSPEVYGSSSLAAVGVAAHECGHAVQHQKGYVPLKIRSALVPLVNLGSTLAWPMILIGLLLGFWIGSGAAGFLVNLGILLFSLAVLFQLVTLPVEFNASARALRIVDSTGFLSSEEMSGAKKVLSAAALTYVAGAVSSILQLLRLIILFGGRRD